tara:strand:- start:222 stop:347 length:126 start_codon:yes stop_codon:yes gene_type:complete
MDDGVSGTIRREIDNTMMEERKGIAEATVESKRIVDEERKD